VLPCHPTGDVGSEEPIAISPGRPRGVTADEAVVTDGASATLRFLSSRIGRSEDVAQAYRSVVFDNRN
jgi:hypothetical protein